MAAGVRGNGACRRLLRGGPFRSPEGASAAGKIFLMADMGKTGNGISVKLLEIGFKKKTDKRY